MMWIAKRFFTFIISRTIMDSAYYLTILTNTILTHYFTYPCTLFLKDDSSRIQYLEKAISLVNIKIDENGKIPKKLFFLNSSCQNIVIHTSNPVSTFRDIEKLIRMQNGRFNERKYLFVSSNDMKENVTDLFQMQELNYVIDILIIVPEYSKKTIIFTSQLDLVQPTDTSEVYELLTHKYVGTITKANEAIVLDKWYSQNCSFLHDTNLYPDKISDQKGRVFRIAAFNYPPYSVIGT